MTTMLSISRRTKPSWKIFRRAQTRPSIQRLSRGKSPKAGSHGTGFRSVNTTLGDMSDGSVGAQHWIISWTDPPSPIDTDLFTLGYRLRMFLEDFIVDQTSVATIRIILLNTLTWGAAGGVLQKKKGNILFHIII